MSVDAFLDTNVLIYAVSSAPAESAKKERALELISHADFGLSSQVLQEFYVNVTTKIALPLGPVEVVALLEQFRCFPMVWTDYSLIVAGIEVALRFGISYWDGAIIAAAERLGATTLYTEDLNHGQRYASVQAVNPFLRGASDSVHESTGPQYG
jgi:predicted nucleic acid-binding protein